MRIVSKNNLSEFWEAHPNAGKPLKDWYRLVCCTDWQHCADVRETYRHADVYCDSVILDIKGNDYRSNLTIFAKPI
jgi:mRNA-degrading endonuclease HigB of HigAB toxin-antitoxin module